ncbi:MAG: L,D-transpeptidase family protein [Gaiellaceae bacterium]
MKRLLALSLLCCCAASGVLAAYAFADDPPPAGTTATTATVTTTTSEAAPLPEGVTVGGVTVGGLTPSDAVGALRAFFATPLPVRIGTHVVEIDPTTLAAPSLSKAVQRALAAQPNQQLGLVVTVRRASVQAFVAKLAKQFDSAPVQSRLILRRLRPYLTPAKPGLDLVRWHAELLIAAALAQNRRSTVTLPVKKTPAKASELAHAPVIVIRRSENHLYLYRGPHYVRRFGVATGQAVYPTPLGHFEIIVKWKNPWWYPPNDAWAKGEKPTPPGPSNPLGTRWMGISAPGVGIHGTNNESSIGYSVSHGCIRMHVADSEWLYDHVEVGTPVFIVAA